MEVAGWPTIFLHQLGQKYVAKTKCVIVSAIDQPSTLGCLYMNLADGHWFSADCTVVHSFVCGVNQTQLECPRRESRVFNLV